MAVRVLKTIRNLMKRILLLLAIISLLITVSCNESSIGPAGPVGPQGPRGFDGLDGEDGENAFVFEYIDINFTAPNYEVFLNYPETFNGLESDVALVYLLWGTEEVNGEVLEIWRLLPQTVLFVDGTLQYNYDFTRNDTRLFLSANFPLDELAAIDTDQWIARVVIVPGDFYDGGRIDLADYQAVVEALGGTSTTIQREVVQRRRL